MLQKARIDFQNKYVKNTRCKFLDFDKFTKEEFDIIDYDSENIKNYLFNLKDAFKKTKETLEKIQEELYDEKKAHGITRKEIGVIKEQLISEERKTRVLERDLELAKSRNQKLRTELEVLKEKKETLIPPIAPSELTKIQKMFGDKCEEVITLQQENHQLIEKLKQLKTV